MYLVDDVIDCNGNNSYVYVRKVLSLYDLKFFYYLVFLFFYIFDLFLI